MGQDRLDDMRIVGDAQLVGDRQQQRIGFRDRLVLLELLDEDVRLGRIAPTEDGSRLLVDEADLIFFPAAMAEIGAIAIVDQCKDAAADRDARLACVATAALERRYSIVRPKNIWPKTPRSRPLMVNVAFLSPVLSLRFGYLAYGGRLSMGGSDEHRAIQSCPRAAA
jgi:hypothetical protein